MSKKFNYAVKSFYLIAIIASLLIAFRMIWPAINETNRVNDYCNEFIGRSFAYRVLLKRRIIDDRDSKEYTLETSDGEISYRDPYANLWPLVEIGDSLKKEKGTSYYIVIHVSGQAPDTVPSRCKEYISLHSRPK